MERIKKIVKILLKLMGALFILLVIAIGIFRYVEQQKHYKLYRHGFQLLEEQLATYIVENYSGVKKVEFSPIFIDPDSHFLHLSVVPIIIDEEGNRSRLDVEYNGIVHGAYTVDLYLNYKDEHVINLLYNTSDNTELDVSGYEHLPEHAKLKNFPRLDESIEAIVEKRLVKNVKKDDKGSPNATIEYNLEIRKGRIYEWY